MIPIALTVENVEMYVRDRVLLLLGVQEASVISVEEITQHTYVNWVFHVSLSNNSRPISVYLRQSRNYTKARPDVYMDPDRTVFEARILRLLTDIVTDVTPEVLWHDQENNVLVLTDVRRGAPVLADELRNGRVHLSCSWSLGRTIAQIHDATRAIANSRARGSDMANRVAKQTSQELRLGPARALHPGDVDRLLRMSDSAEPGLVLGDLGPKNIFVDRDIARLWTWNELLSVISPSI
jgi:5-methylthioribose kinase